MPTIPWMIVWLNGPFGVGKTSVARELVGLLPDARIADPERIGYVMKRTFWRNHDYQDIALWRRLTIRQTRRRGRRSTAIVPMTVVDPAVFAEITEGARVFALTASLSVVEARIGAGREAHDWRLRNLDRCLAAFGTDDLGERIDTDGLTAADVAAVICRRL